VNTHNITAIPAHFHLSIQTKIQAKPINIPLVAPDELTYTYSHATQTGAHRRTEMKMKIIEIGINDLPVIIAGLVREGVTFEAWQTPSGNWSIELKAA
jgi:hypothetical protein